ncbi:MAG: translational machinery protein [Alphaproteobacteria bacterium]|nr:translational machinery protein [Alphaproteobacteria bacterium]
MSHYHAIVWLDHLEARIFHFNASDAEGATINSHSPDRHLHHRAGSRTGNRAPDDHDFFAGVVDALESAREWLIVGPGLAKAAFVGYVRSHHPADVSRIVLVETLGHPTDGELLRLARKRAPAIDRMLPP